MGYMDRGDFSSIGDGDSGSGMGYDYNDWNYAHLDKTYFIFSIIAELIMGIIVIVALLVIYEPRIIDPLENMKKIIIGTQIAITSCLAVATLLVNYLSKDKKKLIKRLAIILLISAISILAFLGIKLGLDLKYTDSKFEQIYIQEYGAQNSDSKVQLGLEKTGITIKTDQEHFVDECVNAYKVFGVRIYAIIGVNILHIMLLIYQISRISRIQAKMDRLNKDDIILDDEEQNIKY